MSGNGTSTAVIAGIAMVALLLTFFAAFAALRQGTIGERGWRTIIVLICAAFIAGMIPVALL